MADAARNLDERFTYGDYRSWQDGERWELIDGKAWCMSPAPKTRHQDIAGALFADLRDFLRGKPCKAIIAPFDIILPRGNEEEDEVDTVVQPDIAVFCDRSKLTKDNARGAPDLVVEVLSPSTAKKDQHEKFELYQRHGVREYWVVDPAGEWLCVYRLGADARFDSGALRERGRGRDWSPIESAVLPGFAVDPEQLFADLD